MTPIIGPLLALLKSRKFLTAVLGLLVDVIIALLPDLEPVRLELLAVVTAVSSILIGAIAYEDAHKVSG